MTLGSNEAFFSGVILNVPRFGSLRDRAREWKKRSAWPVFLDNVS